MFKQFPEKNLNGLTRERAGLDTHRPEIRFPVGKAYSAWGAATYADSGAGLGLGSGCGHSRGATLPRRVNGRARGLLLLLALDTAMAAWWSSGPGSAPTTGVMPELGEGTHGCASVRRTRVA